MWLKYGQTTLPSPWPPLQSSQELQAGPSAQQSDMPCSPSQTHSGPWWQTSPEEKTKRNCLITTNYWPLVYSDDDQYTWIIPNSASFLVNCFLVPAYSAVISVTQSYAYFAWSSLFKEKTLSPFFFDILIPISFLIIPAHALPMLNLPLFKMFIATCGDTNTWYCNMVNTTTQSVLNTAKCYSVRCCVITLNPPPTSPITFSMGTFVFSNVTSHAKKKQKTDKMKVIN